MTFESRKRAARLAMGVCAAALAAGAAQAATVSGELNGLSWTATNTVIGQTATGTPPVPPSTRIGGGGDPIYMPDPSRHSGAVTLIMEQSNGLFICSGSVVGGGRSVVTAGHCVSGGAGTANPIKTTAYFWDYSTQGDERVPFNPSAIAIDVTDYTVHEDYTGEVIDQNDIAVLRLADFAPDFAQRYQLYDEGDLTGEGFNVTGYGGRSTIGGAQGVAPNPPNPSTGHLRQGDNRYDFRWGDDQWGGFFDGGAGGFFGTADNEFSYLSDFDNGLAVNDASCRLAVLFGPADGQFCNTGVGALEVGIAGGDSGGGGFINGRLASVNSYGLAFNGLGDFNPGLNSSWGEFSGYVPIFIHADFIRGAVPEPGTWALMIGGFGLAGGSLRRRRVAKATA